MSQPLLIILGPTASGKTKLAVALAKHFNGEIISADSRQVFRDMNIGTGKDLNEYTTDGYSVSYHLIDIKNAGETYHVNAFKDDFFEAFKKISAKHQLPILCGGTGMYIHSILQNHQLTAIPKNEPLRLQLGKLTKLQLTETLLKYPLQLREKADHSSIKRLIRAIEIAEFLTNNKLEEKSLPAFYPIVIGLQPDLISRRKNIVDRLNFRIKNGLIAEVEGLLNLGISKEMLVFYGLEYKFIALHLSGELDYDTMKERLEIAICQFAKRQMTFFRKMEKDGVQINWLTPDQDFDQLRSNAIALVENKIESN
jgi:tRNA dimethylallyltransferase